MTTPQSTSQQASGAQPTIAPYGSWPSPLGIEQVLTAGVGLRTIIADGDDVHWLESLPDEDGRTTLVRHRGTTTTELTPTPISVRSRVHEYGGGAYDVRDGWVVYCDDSTRAVHVLDPQHHRRPITPEGEPGLHYAGLRIHPSLGIVTAVREDHRGEGEAVTTVVVLQIDGPNDDGGRVLAEGADFYANAEVSPDGSRLALIQWHHPDMPWDGAELQVLDLPRGRILAGGGPRLSFPSWNEHGLVVFSDTGFSRPQLLTDDGPRTLHSIEADHVPPLWVHDNQMCAVLGDGLFVAPFVDGRRQVMRIDLTGRADPQPVGAPFASIDSMASARGLLWLVAGFDDAPDAVVTLDPDTGALEVVRSANSEAPDPTDISVARSVWTPGPHGDVQSWFYPPQLAGWSAPEGELPPLVVRSHGGPTSMAFPAYNPAIQFWTSRGFAVVDVNYSGSTGFGSEYRDRLHGTWGIADVDDCVAVVRHLVSEGLVDADRVAITGGSAGGYTTLQSLVSTDVFSAGISRYGIGDLEVLATDTHKFEARYLDSLVGAWPAERQTYLDRSPIHHVDRLSTPMLILQGLDDKVVPPNQAESMARAVRAKDLPVALVMFEGEGHGFRTVAARRRALQAELSFLAQLFGFTPADDVPVLEIDNLHR